MVITDLELTQAFIEFIGAVICIAFAIILSLGESNKVGKTIRITLVVGAILLITDGCAYIFRGNTEPLSVILNRVGCYGPFICNIAFIILVMQLVYYMTEEHGGRITLAVKTIVYGESAISAIFLLINAFTGFVFYFDSNNIYHRNVGWYVFAFMILLGLLAIIVHTISIRMLIPRHLFIVLIKTFPTFRTIVR